jgi:hypothetical protein
MTTSVGEFRPKGFDAYPLALGDMLRGERATIGKSLEDVQADIKIGVKYIAAIEEGDLSAFDTKGFVAGYVRSYARYLNLDADKAYIQFCRETGFENIKPGINIRKPAKNKYNRQGASTPHNSITMGPIALPTQRWYEAISFSAIGSMLVLLILLSALGFGGWKVLQEVQRVQFAPVNEVPGVASDISVLADGGTLNDTGPILGQTALSDTTSGPVVSLDQLYRPQELDLPSVISRDGPISTINPENLGTYAINPNLIISAAAQVDGPVAIVEQGPPSVDIVAVRPAWIRIYLPDSSVLFEKILNAGERYRLPDGLQGPMLKAGNSGAVYFMIGQKTYGPVGAKGSVAREVALTQSDIEQNYGEVLDLFSEPLAPPLNATQDLTAKAILSDLQNN